MSKVALGLYTYAEFAACAAAFLPVMGVAWHTHRDDPAQRVPGQWMRRFGRTTARLSSMWKFTVEGTPPADIATRPYVVVANHESQADPFLLSFLPWDMRWVAKEELFELPVLGRMMKYGGDIPLRRGARESVVEMMAECRRTLDHGVSVMMFPEGTRSKDANLLPFKPGAFSLAIEAKVPVLPVALAGTHACRPKGSKWFGKASAIARVLEPLSTEGLGPEDAAALADRARSRIAEALPDLRNRTTVRG
ncbi:MAG: 1-acyl-sn-glycerol-3-phosphate acyltransferase [Myxococcales bacterium]|nr:1-acyl-sn-glycerol-3-phosphate acyltransferase [Myxococcales bacterium]